MKITISLDLDWEKELIESRTGYHMEREIEVALLTLTKDYSFSKAVYSDKGISFYLEHFEGLGNDPEDKEEDTAQCAVANMLGEISDLEKHYNSWQAVKEANRELEMEDAADQADWERLSQ